MNTVTLSPVQVLHEPAISAFKTVGIPLSIRRGLFVFHVWPGPWPFCDLAWAAVPWARHPGHCPWLPVASVPLVTVMS